MEEREALKKGDRRRLRIENVLTESRAEVLRDATMTFIVGGVIRRLQARATGTRPAEKGGNAHAVPVHHKAEQFLVEYLAALGNPTKGPLFRAMTRERGFGKNRMNRIDAFRMVKSRCRP